MPLGTIPDSLSYGAVDLASSPPTSRLTPKESKALLAVVAGPFALWGGTVAVSSMLASTSAIRLGLSYYRSPLPTLLAYEGRSAFARASGRAILLSGRAYRYAGYYQFLSNPFATLKYLKEGEYAKAMIQYFGPVGSVFVYNKFTGSQKTTEKRVVPRQTRKSRKPSQIPKKQKMRLWRMGLRWCRQHGRYDRCSLRARK